MVETWITTPMACNEQGEELGCLPLVRSGRDYDTGQDPSSDHNPGTPLFHNIYAKVKRNKYKKHVTQPQTLMWYKEYTEVNKMSAIK